MDLILRRVFENTAELNTTSSSTNTCSRHDAKEDGREPVESLISPWWTVTKLLRISHVSELQNWDMHFIHLQLCCFPLMFHQPPHYNIMRHVLDLRHPAFVATNQYKNCFSNFLLVGSGTLSMVPMYGCVLVAPICRHFFS